MQKIQQIFFLSPTDDTDEHGYSFCRTRITRIDTDILLRTRMSRMNTDILFTEHGLRGLTRIISDNEELRILVKEIIIINHIGFNVFIRK